MKDWKVDIGDAVKAGQTLAEIEAPDLDQQLLQARADLTSAEASAKLSEVTLSRGRTLLTSAAVSQQDVDQRAADLGNKQAAVHSGEANVERLEVLAGYKTVAAPFDGIVTERNTDVGALISAGSSAGRRCSSSPTCTSCASRSMFPRPTRPRSASATRRPSLRPPIPAAPSRQSSKPRRARSTSPPARPTCS